MADLMKGLTFFKPSGEPIRIDGEKVDAIGEHSVMGGTLVQMDDGNIIHTNLPFMLQTDTESVEGEVEELMEEGE